MDAPKVFLARIRVSFFSLFKTIFRTFFSLEKIYVCRFLVFNKSCNKRYIFYIYVFSIISSERKKVSWGVLYVLSRKKFANIVSDYLVIDQFSEIMGLVIRNQYKKWIKMKIQLGVSSFFDKIGLPKAFSTLHKNFPR